MELSYAKVWRKHSDAALDEWDDTLQKAELAAFRKLEHLGDNNPFLSPSKANDGFYTERLRRHTRTRPKNGTTCSNRKRGKSFGTIRTSMDAAVEIRRRRTRTRSRRQRRGAKADDAERS